METPKRGFNSSIALDSFQLSYDDVGEGDIPIIFLHGFPFSKNMWAGQLASLRSTCRVIACDIRGFGKSVDESSSLSIDLFTEDLIAFMDKLSIDKAIICGLSMGGFIALNALAKHPQRFEALILANTQCIADTPEVKANRYTTIDTIEIDGAAEFNEKFVTSVFHPDSIIHKGQLVDQLRSVVFANSDRIICQGLVALAERPETCSSLQDITIPTLIISGRADVVTPLAQSESMHKSINGSILHVIENAGHVSNLEQPKEFNQQVLDFVTSVLAAYTK
ncbi:MAG TPA: alpha/beta hydrolase [Candidatus Didemnitutus sp.]|nr:alpha/beta hydrolase [Candidatus Didemnitutus sp.]